MIKSQNIIVLGSEGSLGTEIIRQLRVKNFSNIIAVDKDSESKFSDISYLCADFSNPDQVHNLTEKLSSMLTVDNILISTIGKFGDDHSNGIMDYNSILLTIQINLLSLTKLCLSISNNCIKNHYKMRFVIVGSAAGNVGSHDLGYGISKSGLNGLIISLSKCFARQNIITIGVNPGIFTSTMSTSVAMERQKSVINQTHIKRSGFLSEITNTVLYSALEAPDFLTGSLINVNGGQYS